MERELKNQNGKTKANENQQIIVTLFFLFCLALSTIETFLFEN